MSRFSNAVIFTAILLLTGQVHASVFQSVAMNSRPPSLQAYDLAFGSVFVAATDVSSSDPINLILKMVPDTSPGGPATIYAGKTSYFLAINPGHLDASVFTNLGTVKYLLGSKYGNFKQVSSNPFAFSAARSSLVGAVSSVSTVEVTDWNATSAALKGVIASIRGKNSPVPMRVLFQRANHFSANIFKAFLITLISSEAQGSRIEVFSASVLDDSGAIPLAWRNNAVANIATTDLYGYVPRLAALKP